MISATENAMNIEEKNGPEMSAEPAEEKENLSELEQKIWAVVSFEKCEKTGLTYDEAAAELERLRAENISGLCILTAEAAEKIIEQGIDEFRRKQESRKVADLIVSYRAQAELIKQSELERALKSLESGQTPEQVVAKLAHGLMNKLIHSPTQYLRQAGAEADQEALQRAAEVLGITDTKESLE